MRKSARKLAYDLQGERVSSRRLDVLSGCDSAREAASVGCDWGRPGRSECWGCLGALGDTSGACEQFRCSPDCPRVRESSGWCIVLADAFERGWVSDWVLDCLASSWALAGARTGGQQWICSCADFGAFRVGGQCVLVWQTRLEGPGATLGSTGPNAKRGNARRVRGARTLARGWERCAEAMAVGKPARLFVWKIEGSNTFVP